jgi:hypothetical protein
MRVDIQGDHLVSRLKGRVFPRLVPGMEGLDKTKWGSSPLKSWRGTLVRISHSTRMGKGVTHVEKTGVRIPQFTWN